MKEKLCIIGVGPGDEAMLTAGAKAAIEAAHRVLHTRETPLPELLSALDTAAGGATAVLVSGDCGFYSAAKMIVRDYADRYEIEALPGIGSIPYFSAKIKTSYDDAVLLSLHGRGGNIVAKVAYNRKVFALTGGEHRVRDICGALCRYGLGGVHVSVGERLSYLDERIVSDKADALQGMDFDGLSVMFIENPSAADPHTPLRDGDFLRGDAPMTKEEVRWLSVQKLGIRPEDIVYDVGAGTGSVSVEMARRAFGGFVYAIEAKEDACELVRANAAKHGAHNIEIVCGEAPAAFASLPIPDKAFIGGSAGNMDGILEELTARNPQIRIVANAIALQTVHQLREGFAKHGVGGTDIVCVNIAKAKKAGEYDMMMAQNPVYIITGTGGDTA